MKASKTLNAVGYITLFASFCLMGIFLYWVFWPYRVIDFFSVKGTQETHAPGSTFEIEIDYCKYLPLPAVVTKQFIGNHIYTLPTQFTANTPAGCGVVHATDIKIPVELDPGSYTFIQTMTYKVNPVREVSVVFNVPLVVESLGQSRGS